MFLKYGDNTKVSSVEDSSVSCENCGKKVLIINNEKICKCEENSEYKKSNDFFTQKKISTNLEQ